MVSAKQIKQDRAHMAENYSNESVDSACVSCPQGKQKVIYLTFDDGPEPGTVEIYLALKAKGIAATFFFVGENVLACEDGTFAGLYPKAGLMPGLFKKIFDDPLFQIGSHSQTQSHQFYKSYYDTGLKIDRQTLKPAAKTKEPARRSVLVDFELANLTFSYALQNTVSDKTAQYTTDLQKLNSQKEYGYRGDDVKERFTQAGIHSYVRFLTARLPGTNRWRLPWNNESEIDWLSADRDDEANDLYDNSYYIFGWHLEWQFSGGDSTMSAEVLAEHDANEDGWWDYFGRNIDKDRPRQSVDEMFAATQAHLDSMWDKTWFGSNDDSKAVILLHDRLFRSDADTSATAAEPNQYIKQLLEFIDKCQQQGYHFDVLENY